MKHQPRISIVGQLIGRNKGFVTTQGQILADCLESEGFDVTSVSSKLSRFLRVIDVVRTIVRKRRTIDLMIIEVYSGMSFVLADIASFFGALFHLPVVFFLHGGNLPDFAQRYPRWTRRVLARADHLAAPSRFLADKMSRLAANITVIPNIVALEKYNYRHRKMIKPRLLWMRSFHDIYNPELAVEAFALVRERYPDATMVMAGPDKGELRKTIQLVSKLGLADCVFFPGFLDDDRKSHEFDRADIFLNTTRIDNMPVGVVEACAAGLPVVATDVGGLSVLLTDRQTGMLVSNGDPRAIADAIEELIANPGLAETLSRNGRAIAENSAWPNVFSQWNSLFEKILGSPDLAGTNRSQEGLRRREA